MIFKIRWGQKQTLQQLGQIPDSNIGPHWYLSLSRIHLQCRRPQFDFWVGKICWRRDRLPTPIFLGFPCDSAGKESACNVGDLGLIPGLGRSPGQGKGYPLQYSDLENSMDCLVQGVAKSWTQLVTFTSLHFQLVIFEHQGQWMMTLFKDFWGWQG